MSLLKSIVLLDVMKVVSSDDDCSFHLHALNSTSQDSSSDADVASKWTLLINVCAINSLCDRQVGHIRKMSCIAWR